MSESRSTVRAPRAMVATSQPLAAQAGLATINAGGNAIDAAIAAAAVLGVVEPMSTGIGGDGFALVYLRRQQRLFALNSSGRAPLGLTLDHLRSQSASSMPQEGILSATVPGAVAGWETLRDRFGSLPLATLLEPAIQYAEAGFPVSEIIAGNWRAQEEKLARHPHTAQTFLVDGRAPRAGERFSNPRLAQTLQRIADEGTDVFYRGPVAKAIVSESERLGGRFALADFERHHSDWVEPLSTEFCGAEIYEMPPNTQGLIALLALGIANRIPAADVENPAQWHRLIESIKRAFDGGRDLIADPEFANLDLDSALSPEQLQKLSTTIGREAQLGQLPAGLEGGTVYISAVDEERNVVSYIESVFQAFGSGITAGETGVLLQDRGALFSLDERHPNCLAPGKRPYHTILPAMAFRNGQPWLSFGVVGGFMQPQGHLQLLSNRLEGGMSIQQAIESPRFRYFAERRVSLEPGVPAGVRYGLAERGHELIEGDGYFGGAQAIELDDASAGLAGGSDPRKDGCAQGF